MITGVGSAYIDKPIYGLPTAKAEEFIADGLGARYETDLDRMIVVSMGTGTSLVQCDGDDIRHIGIENVSEHDLATIEAEDIVK